MKHTHKIAVFSLSVLLMGSASTPAQSARFSDIDRNGNGLLSYSELVRAFGREGANKIWSLGGRSDLSRRDIRRMNQNRDNDRRGISRSDRDDDDDGRLGRSNRDDDDDDGRRSVAGRDDDDDNGGSRGGRGGGGRDDDDDDGGRGNDDDD
ncbi:hypothetical protein [Paracoccus albus]|uniref:hypothetical protein n=1 Tax=Paracoccus albus TaxID=3017784 RepID=UPI0022F03C9A|nr:hypothetical protein [Paracoccus albus]WBU62112.1 hypothetical protein PAF20_16765 [Paracoccus albus]